MTSITAACNVSGGRVGCGAERGTHNEIQPSLDGGSNTREEAFALRLHTYTPTHNLGGYPCHDTNFALNTSCTRVRELGITGVAEMSNCNRYGTAAVALPRRTVLAACLAAVWMHTKPQAPRTHDRATPHPRPQKTKG
jgi:hypothetical protein